MSMALQSEYARTPIIHLLRRGPLSLAAEAPSIGAPPGLSGSWAWLCSDLPGKRGMGGLRCSDAPAGEGHSEPHWSTDVRVVGWAWTLGRYIDGVRAPARIGGCRASLYAPLGLQGLWHSCRI